MAMDKEKQKIVIAAVLAVVVVGVGVFQIPGLMGGDQTTPKTAKKEKVKVSSDDPIANAGDEPAMKKGDVIATKYAARDPFEPVQLDGSPIPNPVQPTANPDSTKNPESTPKVAKSSPRSTHGGSGGGGITVPPLLPGTPNGPTGPIAQGNGGGAPNGPGGTSLSPAPPLRQPGEPTYSLSGVVTGDSPMAVVRGDDGKEKIVRIGGSLDRDSKVIGITKGKIVVQTKSKRVILRMGEGSHVENPK